MYLRQMCIILHGAEVYLQSLEDKLLFAISPPALIIFAGKLYNEE